MKCIACNQELPYKDDKLLGILYTLSPREYRVIIERFLLGKRLEDVAKYFSVTRDRIKQIEEKAYRKLKFRTKRLGIALTPDHLKSYLESVKDKLQGVEQVPRYEMVKDFDYKECGFVGYLTDLIPEKMYLSDLDKIQLKEIPLHTLLYDIDVLELSIRTSNALKNNGGIYKIIDLINMTEESLIRIHSVGKKGLKEIKDSLLLMGLRIGLKVDPKEVEKINKEINHSFSEISNAIDEYKEKELKETE